MSRVALITGAARGIGAATCRELVTQGWSVVATDRGGDDPRLPYPLATASDLEATVASCNAIRAGSCVAIVADATSREAVDAAVRTSVQTFGGLDAVVAGAGVIAGGVPLWEMADDQLEAVLDVNLRGVITVARAAIPALLERPAPRDGRFVALASSAAARGLDQLAAYCAAKAGVVGLVRSLAHELSGTGVTATAVSPGSTDTDILAQSAALYGLTSVEEFAVHQPVGRLLTAEEIARVVAVVAGPDGAVFNGANLAADGGMTA
ncbi:mycofactocin-coupled SDR family oxidoreductase [Euzebya tangerina]|uniref:mycofactocin-coupled SDR family oxidoreductase n=1 Tax=Euzebya tangerina TaxID=591198 RepID=UPI00196BB1B0|nr:mycofactocin-coupled SDR family oxidoreductase [Euzebya tangerina]